jgi:6-phosphofructokinase 1
MVWQQWKLVLDHDYNVMVALQGDKIIRVPLSQAGGKTRNVPLDSELIRAGRSIGVCFGD